MLTFEKLRRAWMAAIFQNKTYEISSLLADGFRWLTYTQDPAGLDAAGTNDFV